MKGIKSSNIMRSSDKRNDSNNCHNPFQISHRSNGYLIDCDVREAKIIKSSDYGVLFIDNSKMEYNIPKKDYFILFSPKAMIFLENFDNIYNRSRLYIITIPIGLFKKKPTYYQHNRLQTQIKKILLLETDNYLKSFLNHLKVVSSLEIDVRENLVYFKVQELLNYLVKTKGKVIRDFISDM